MSKSKNLLLFDDFDFESSYEIREHITSRCLLRAIFAFEQINPRWNILRQAMDGTADLNYLGLALRRKKKECGSCFFNQADGASNILVEKYAMQSVHGHLATKDLFYRHNPAINSCAISAYKTYSKKSREVVVHQVLLESLPFIIGQKIENRSRIKSLSKVFKFLSDEYKELVIYNLDIL
jgi:hypothetical protein